VIEFGGGYGSFARLAFRLGFPGQYHVYDFPEMTALQRYFVASVAEHRGNGAFAERFHATPEMAALPQANPDNGLFVALWSLSETPAEQREPWVEIVGGSSAVLMAFQHQFEATDNRAWFADLQLRVPQLRWVVEEIEQLPGNAYIFGQR
jgi:hypothetical protein